MEENRKIFYYLAEIGNADALQRAVARINGVVSVKVDEDAKTLEYVIDEWASDYDVFTEVIGVCAECGAVIDFDRADEEVDLKEEDANTILPEEEVELPDEVEESAPEKPAKKEKKALISERWQRVIELSVSVAACVVAFFLTDIIQYVFLAISFALAGYDALYDAIVKMTKKQIISEELVICLALFASILLGYAVYAVVGLLLYSIVAFARKTIREEIDKNPAFAQGGQTVSRTSEAGIEKVEPEKIEIGENIILEENKVCPFDGVVQGECEIEDFKGNVRSVVGGAEIYAGEKVLSEVQITVTAKGEECKFGKYNKFVNEAANKTSPLAEKLQKHAQLIYICVLAVSLIIAFVPPIFAPSYKTALYEWGLIAVIIAVLSGLSFYTFASQINLLSLLARGRKCKLGFAGYKSVLKLANSKKLFIDFENTVLDEDGQIKEDAVGAIRELKDAGVKDISLMCSLKDSDAEDVCKALKIKEYYSRESDQKIAELKKSLTSGASVATSACLFESLEGEENKGAVVAFNCEEQGYSGDACISSDQIAYLPYAVKLAKRTAKIQKFNLALGIGVKAVLVALALLGFAKLWWVVLADAIVSVICAIASFINSKEMY
ncbi:MAG: hypothetical protein IJA15_03715 [Clostridia bacterium]|nr:hypothetical protein [Clostridia bacterium]